MDRPSAKHLAWYSLTPERVAIIPLLVVLPKVRVPSDAQLPVPEALRLTLSPPVFTEVLLQFAANEFEPTV